MRRIAGARGGFGRSSSHVMPTWASAVAGIYGCDIPASALLSYSCFLLDKKAPKNQGRHHRSQRIKRALPRHVGRAHAPNPIGFWHSRSRHKTKTALQRTKPHPLPSWRTRIRHLLRSWDTLLVIASRHREERSDPFIKDLCKICF